MINVLVGSQLFELLKQHVDTRILVAFFSFLAAAMGGVATYLNVNRNVETHRKVGNLYLSISRRAYDLQAEFLDGYIDAAVLRERYLALHKEYEQANEQGESCPNSVGDYSKAFKRNHEHKNALKMRRQAIALAGGEKRMPQLPSPTDNASTTKTEDATPDSSG